MRVFSRNFLVGFGAGVLTALLAAFGGSLLLARLLITPENLERTIGPPAFPSVDAADYGWTLRTLDGRDFDLRGTQGRVVFLNWWATWCAPCRAELPSIQRLYERLGGDGVEFVLASQEDAATVRRFVEEGGYTFPAYTLPGDPPAMFKPEVLPTTFILSRDGKVAFKHVGFARWDDEKSVDFIRALLQREPAEAASKSTRPQR